MKIVFGDKELNKIMCSEYYNKKRYHPDTVRKYRSVVQLFSKHSNLSELNQYASLNLEKVCGTSDVYSVRVNGGIRLYFNYRKGKPINIIKLNALDEQHDYKLATRQG